jgi:hypothetical protein
VSTPWTAYETLLGADRAARNQSMERDGTPSGMRWEAQDFPGDHRRIGMNMQFGTAGTGSNMQASFLRGGIVTRHLPSADASPGVWYNETFRPRAAATQTYICSENPHIPACRIPTDGCTTGTPTDNTCATDLQICGTITQTSNCASIVNCQ